MAELRNKTWLRLGALCPVFLLLQHALGLGMPPWSTALAFGYSPGQVPVALVKARLLYAAVCW